MSNTKFYTDSIKVCHFASANMKGWTYVRTSFVRRIFSELKLLGSIDYHIFSPMVLRCARESSANITGLFNMHICKQCNRTSQHEHIHELWQGWLGRLRRSPKHIKMPVPINATKTFQQPLVGQKPKDKPIVWSQIKVQKSKF